MSIVETEQQTTNDDDDDKIVIIEENLAIGIAAISNKDSTNSIIDSKLISLFNSDTQIKETSSLLDSSEKSIKKVILIVILFKG